MQGRGWLEGIGCGILGEELRDVGLTGFLLVLGGRRWSGALGGVGLGGDFKGGDLAGDLSN